MIGVAFSVGFLLGPLIGAAFSLQAKGQEGEFFVTPALYALTLAILDVLFLVVFLKETLPREKRVSVPSAVVFRVKSCWSIVFWFMQYSQSKFLSFLGNSSYHVTLSWVDCTRMCGIDIRMMNILTLGVTLERHDCRLFLLLKWHFIIIHLKISEKILRLCRNYVIEILYILQFHMFFQALSLGSGFRQAVSLIYPGMLFNFSAVKGVSEKGGRPILFYPWFKCRGTQWLHLLSLMHTSEVKHIKFLKQKKNYYFCIL